MTDWITIVQTVGFPIAMCAWFMFRTEKGYQRLSDCIEQNTLATQQLVIEIKK